MTSQKLELVPPGEVSMGSRQEVQVAQKEARLDQAVKGSSYSSEKGRPKGREKGKEKGKEKGRGKGKDSENKKSA
jgi:flagellar biosynthesis/type III secretory pathway protein FliH